ncbi:hypothetical protein F5B20DRAFT_527106 [Whalleya microplaca]|nr:hypothetical protein F5B20DRAFT_527106 [Whalleya microplaca]
MVARPALAAAGCSHCHLAVLRLFTCPASTFTFTLSPITRTAGLLQYRPPSIVVSPARAFSSHPVPNQSSNYPDIAEKEREEEHGRATTEGSSPSSPSSTPWYLQVDPPRHVASIEPPPLPEVPENSPEIIGSLLQYASEEMGLDHLSLLDLRRLDPPPALGPNLFMLFGTARSARHLNVSAGRLVRWLRAKYRIWADADGLLGPNERKTKLRRKAKRAKLLGTMGTDDADDGISTDWICVNLGTTDRGTQEQAIVAEDGRVAGFGVPQKGSTIVVQIMTESRRAELGLETLWQEALDRPRNLYPLEETIVSDQPASGGSRFGDASRKASLGQARSYSTERVTSRNASEPDPLFPVTSAAALGKVLTYDAERKHHLLQLLRHRIDQSSRDETRSYLSDELPSTPFRQLLELSLRNLPPYQTWRERLAIQNKARISGLNTPFETVQRLVEEMHVYDITGTHPDFLQLLACIYSSRTTTLSNRSKLALELLQMRQQRGRPIITNEIIVTIIDAAARANRHDPELPALVTRLQNLLLQAGLPCMEEALLKKLMVAYTRMRRMESFWDTWRIPPRYLRPRSEAMYSHLYKIAAATGSSKFCTQVLRRCFPEMLLENPPIKLTGDVRENLMDCIRIADPTAEVQARNISSRSVSIATREFVKLVRYLDAE